MEAINRTHIALRFGDPALDLEPVADAATARLLADADQQVVRLQAAAQAQAAAPSVRADELLAAIDDFRSDLVGAGNELVAASSRRAILFDRILIAAIALGFAALLAVVMFLAPRSRRRRTLEATLRRAGGTGHDVDHLTGLPTRPALRAAIEQAAEDAESGNGFAALFAIGIDDQAGAPVAADSPHRDRLVRTLASRLRATLRSTDVVARIDQDTFAVLLAAVPKAEDVGRVAAKLVETVGRPIRHDDTETLPVASVGVALAPTDSDSPDGLIQRALTAMREVRKHGGGDYRYYSPEMTARASGAIGIIEALGTAIRTGNGLWLAYQPKIALDGGRLVGFEALVRWSDSQLGDFMPDDFIPIAEQSDLIIDLGRWVIDETARQLREWVGTPLEALPVSVNVSPRQVRHGSLTDIVTAALERNDIPPAWLELELTEAILLDDETRPFSRIRDLRRIGVKVSIDDFGTGYSSLSYLKRLPVDALKIDRAFVAELSAGSHDAAISAAIVTLGHELSLEVIAEGVETETQQRVLQDLGCDTAQGFFYSEPLPAVELDGLAVVAGRTSRPNVLRLRADR
jgi:diguanylate cyclase (GGDEF)-like protein